MFMSPRRSPDFRATALRPMLPLLFVAALSLLPLSLHAAEDFLQRLSTGIDYRKQGNLTLSI